MKTENKIPSGRWVGKRSEELNKKLNVSSSTKSQLFGVSVLYLYIRL